MRNNKGFSLIEVLVAFSIIFMIATTIIPIASLINTELEILSQRRTFTNRLHDEMQTYLWNEKVKTPHSFSEMVKKNNILFHFTTENNLIKGCVEWQNVKQSNEKFCLYGLPEK